MRAAVVGLENQVLFYASADPSITTVPGEWPTLSYNIVTVAGAENPLPSPIYLVELDTERAVLVGRKDKELTLPEMPGFNLTVKASSVTFPNGAREGYLPVTPVNASKVPTNRSPVTTATICHLHEYVVAIRGAEHTREVRQK